MIDLKNLNKSFSQGERSIEVLKNLSLNLGSGETLAVLGQSGSGKSTLLNLLFGTTFDVMDDDFGRQQTTKGIWMSCNEEKNEFLSQQSLQLFHYQVEIQTGTLHPD